MRKLNPWWAIIILFFSTTLLATFSEVDRQEITARNLLKNNNPGFEQDKSNWTISGGDTFTIDTSTQLIGNGSAVWDSAGAARTFSIGSVAIPVGWQGRNGVGSCLIKTASGTATHTLDVTDLTLNLVSTTITSSTTPTRTTGNFIFPTSGSVQLRISSVASNEPSIEIDNCFIGLAEDFNISNIGQTAFIGSGYFVGTTNCAGWSRTNTALGAFASDTDCPGPTVELNPGPGVIQTTDADLPKFTVNNLPPGYYEVIFMVPGNQSSGSNAPAFAISDGTTTGITNSGASGGTNEQQIVIGYFLYTTTANRSFQLFGASSAGSVSVPSDTGQRQLSFSIKRFPTSAEQAFRSDDVSWRIDANISGAHITLGTADQTAYITPNNSGLTLTQNSGSASVGISCSTTNDNTVGTTTCGAGSEEPGIVVNVPRAGTVEYCFEFSHNIVNGISGAVDATFEVVETANGSQTVSTEGKSRVQSGSETATTSVSVPLHVCGKISHTSAGKKTIRLMYEQDTTATVTTNQLLADAGANNGQRDIHVTARYDDLQTITPQTINSVVNTATGVTRVEAARLNCDSASTIIAQQGSWIASIGNVSGGACAVTITTGIFSAAPYCTVTEETGASADPLNIGFTTAPTTTALSVDAANNAGTDSVAFDFDVICVGAK